MSEIFFSGGLLNWVFLTLLMLAFALFLSAFLYLNIHKAGNPDFIRRISAALLYLSAASFCLSVFGYLLEFYRLPESGRLFASNPVLLLLLNTGLPLEAELLREVSRWLTQTAPLVLTGLPVAVLTFLLWFLLTAKMNRRQRIRQSQTGAVR